MSPATARANAPTPGPHPDWPWRRGHGVRATAPVGSSLRPPESERPASRRKGSEFYEEPSLEPRFRSRLADFKGSGYDRGHMVPSPPSTRALSDLLPPPCPLLHSPMHTNAQYMAGTDVPAQDVTAQDSPQRQDDG